MVGRKKKFIWTFLLDKAEYLRTLSVIYIKKVTWNGFTCLTWLLIPHEWILGNISIGSLSLSLYFDHLNCSVKRFYCISMWKAFVITLKLLYGSMSSPGGYPIILHFSWLWTYIKQPLNFVTSFCNLNLNWLESYMNKYHRYL